MGERLQQNAEGEPAARAGVLGQEYLVRVWGAFFDPEFRELHGIQPGHYWFGTKAERECAISGWQQVEETLNAPPLMLFRAEGPGCRVRTVVRITMTFRGKDYHYKRDCGYAYTRECAEFLFHGGHRSCDCYRSLLLSRKYEDFPILQCARRIKMKDFKVEFHESSGKEFEPAECRMEDMEERA